MPYELQGFIFSFALLATLAMLVKHERRMKRWLMRSRRRRKRPYRQPVLP